MERRTVLIFLLALFPLFALGKESLNFMESRLFRFSAIDRVDQFFVPGHNLLHPKATPYPFDSQFFLYGNSDLKDLYEDLSSDNGDKILERIDDSYGKPFNLITRLGIQYQYKRFRQSLAANGGEIFILNNPVFPELSGIILLDFSSVTSYSWFGPKSKFQLESSIIISRRKSLRKTVSAVSLGLNSGEFKLNQTPWYNSFESNLQLSYDFSFIKLLALGQSLPLGGQRFSYWETLLGVQTQNLMKETKRKYLGRWVLYAFYSPLYGGNYDVERTLQLGTGLGLSRHLIFDLYYSGNKNFNGSLTLNLENLSFKVYSQKESYDDFYFQDSRSFGLSSHLKF